MADFFWLLSTVCGFVEGLFPFFCEELGYVYYFVAYGGVAKKYTTT